MKTIIQKSSFKRVNVKSSGTRHMENKRTIFTSSFENRLCFNCVPHKMTYGHKDNKKYVAKKTEKYTSDDDMKKKMLGAPPSNKAM